MLERCPLRPGQTAVPPDAAHQRGRWWELGRDSPCLAWKRSPRSVGPIEAASLASLDYLAPSGESATWSEQLVHAVNASIGRRGPRDCRGRPQWDAPTSVDPCPPSWCFSRPGRKRIPAALPLGAACQKGDTPGGCASSDWTLNKKPWASCLVGDKQTKTLRLTTFLGSALCLVSCAAPLDGGPLWRFLGFGGHHRVADASEMARTGGALRRKIH